MRAKKGRLRRERRIVKAVDGISFSLERGTIVGYLGPNGAGKSTTVKMLTGILVPSAGTIRVAGLDPSRQRIELARRIGVVFGQRSQLWWDLPLADSFELLRHIYRVPAERHRASLDRFAQALDLGPFLATPVRQLSLGQRMRGELDGRAPARAGRRLPRRADDRARRRGARRRAASSSRTSTASAASPCS